jgi:hypothetical protein
LASRSMRDLYFVVSKIFVSVMTLAQCSGDFFCSMAAG